MKFNSLFLLIISLANVSSLVDIHPAYAQKQNNRGCKNCVINRSGAIRGGGTIPAELVQQSNGLINQGNFAEAERLLLQFKEQANLNGQAEANEALGVVYQRKQIQLQQIQLQQRNR